MFLLFKNVFVLDILDQELTHKKELNRDEHVCVITRVKIRLKVEKKNIFCNANHLIGILDLITTEYDISKVIKYKQMFI